MSIVPLNFGAAAPLRLKPHFWHVLKPSSFCVPQFGQNTLDYLRYNPAELDQARARLHRNRGGLKGGGEEDGASGPRPARTSEKTRGDAPPVWGGMLPMTSADRQQSARRA